MEKIQLNRISSDATEWANEKVSRIARRDRTNRLAVLYLILADLVLLLFMGVVDTDGGIEAWLFLNGIALIVTLFVRATIMWTDDGF